ncbi:MAG: aldose epimerase family protein [Roseobacter sp.]
MIQLRSKVLRATILPYGGTLTGLWHKDAPHSLVLGSTDNLAYRNALTFFGALVGPVANRVRNATLIIEGQKCHLPENEGTTSLHSGPQGLHAQFWTIAEQSETALTLHCHLAHGSGGLPGNRDIRATYTVSDAGVLSLTVAATSDAATVMNIAHHPYWNLDGSATVDNHKLEVRATAFTPVDTATLLPTGEIASVQGTQYDFQRPRAVATQIPLDCNLCLADHRRRAPQISAILSAPAGPRLTLHTTEPGLQLYNGAGLGPVDAKMHDREDLRAHAGIALEPQGWPDAPNHPAFPSILLPANARYQQTTEYHLS